MLILSARVTKSLTKCLMKTPQHEREVYLVISDIVVKGLQERCVDIGDKFFAITKRGDHDHAFKVIVRNMHALRAYFVTLY